MRIFLLALPLLLLACAREATNAAFDARVEAAALIALASDSATPSPSPEVVCFEVTDPRARRRRRAPSDSAWQQIRVAFPRARSGSDCYTQDTVEVWGAILDSIERRDATEIVAWGTLIAEHANVWRCVLRQRSLTWIATPCEWQHRAPQDRG